MHDKRGKRKSFWGELLTPGYLGRARQRAQRRRSPWNIILIPLVLCSWGSITYGLFRVMWHAHTLLYPAHAGRLREFWGRNISGPSFVSSFMLFMPLLFAAIPLGMMVADCIAWCIPPARHAFEREAQGVEWVSFPEAMRSLWRISLVAVPVCVFLSLVGAATLKNLR
jgi:hypothetical protein